MSDVAASEMRNQAHLGYAKDSPPRWPKAQTFSLGGLGGSETRNQAQKPAHKDIRPKWQNQPFRSDATYAPVSNRA